MSKWKVKAFTIIELTITMLVAALLIGLVFTIFSIVQRSFRSFEKTNEDLLALSGLDKLLKRDISRARQIRRTQDGLMMRTDSDAIAYQFLPDAILRKQGIVDTFKIKYQEVFIGFEARPVEPDVDGINDTVDELNFLVDLHEQKIFYHYKKVYSSSDLMK